MEVLENIFSVDDADESFHVLDEASMRKDSEILNIAEVFYNKIVKLPPNVAHFLGINYVIYKHGPSDIRRYFIYIPCKKESRSCNFT